MTEESTKKPLWRRVLRKILLIGIILVVAGIAVLSIWNYRISSQLRTEIAKIRAAGEPVTFQDLEARFPKVEESVNAARFYRAGMALIVRAAETEDLTRELSDYSKKGPGALPDKRLIARARSVLADNSVALAMLDNGTKLPACRNDDLWIKNGISATLPKLSSPRQAARLLSVRTCLLTLEGKADEATNSALTSLRMTRLIDDQPLLVAYLVKVARQSVAYGDVRFILQFARPSETALAALQEAVLATEQPHELGNMILGERVYQIEIMRSLIPGATDLPIAQGSALLPERWPGSFRLSPWAEQMAVDTLRNSHAILSAVRNSWPKAFNELRSLQPIGLFGKILTPAYAQVAVTVGRNMAACRCTAAASMIERYRLAHGGKPPETLSDLVPVYGKTIPLDPFSGKPLLYRRGKDSYTVYSVNDNQVDDGGVLELEPPPTSRDTRPTYPDWGVRIRLK